MPEIRADLTVASEGGKTRFSTKTDSMAELDALMGYFLELTIKTSRDYQFPHLHLTDCVGKFSGPIRGLRQLIIQPMRRVVCSDSDPLISLASITLNFKPV
jgi:hypothetical protein